MEKAKVIYVCIGKTISTILEVLLFYDYQLIEFFSSYNRCITYFILHIRVLYGFSFIKYSLFASIIHTCISMHVNILEMISIFILRESNLICSTFS